MIRGLFWSLPALVLTLTPGSTAETRRVVTGIDKDNKAIVLFDSSLTLKPGGSGNPAANLWMTDSLPPGFSFKEDTATKPLGLSPARGLPPKHPLMHRTRTVDYAIIMAGEIDMMLDDAVVHVKAGDVVIQQATNHAWVNRGKEPCRIVFVLMDSKQP